MTVAEFPRFMRKHQGARADNLAPSVGQNLIDGFCGGLPGKDGLGPVERIMRLNRRRKKKAPQIVIKISAVVAGLRGRAVVPGATVVRLHSPADKPR